MKFYTWVWHPDRVMSSKEDPEGLWVSRTVAEKRMVQLENALRDLLEEVGSYMTDGNVIRQAEALLTPAQRD